MAKRLIERIGAVTNIPCVEYLFDEESCPLPNLGGIQTTMGKRHRHRRALMRMLFDYFEMDRLVVCMDPARLDLLEDFAMDRSTTRLLEVECQFSDEFLVGHANRVGLIGNRTSSETISRLMPTVRNDLQHESDRIRDKAFDNHYQIREIDPVEANARMMANFLTVSEADALEIVSLEYLFSD